MIIEVRGDPLAGDLFGLFDLAAFAGDVAFVLQLELHLLHHFRGQIGIPPRHRRIIHFRPLQDLRQGGAFEVAAVQVVDFLGDGGFHGPDLAQAVGRHEAQPFRVRRHPEDGVVLPQEQAVFRARGEHPVRFVRAFRHQIIDQHADIGLVPLQYNLFPAK